MAHRLRILLTPLRCMSNTTSSKVIEPKIQEQGLSTNVESSHKDETTDDLYRFLRIKCSCSEIGVLDSYERFLKLAAQHLNIEHAETVTPFRTIKRRTLLASRHVHKKYRTQYEFRSYYRDVVFKNLTGSTLDTFLEYVERNIPEGMLFVAEKHRLAELPFELENKED